MQHLQKFLPQLLQKQHLQKTPGEGVLRASELATHHPSLHSSPFFSHTCTLLCTTSVVTPLQSIRCGLFSVATEGMYPTPVSWLALFSSCSENVSQVVCTQAVPHSFAKTPGGPLPLLPCPATNPLFSHSLVGRSLRTRRSRMVLRDGLGVSSHASLSTFNFRLSTSFPLLFHRSRTTLSWAALSARLQQDAAGAGLQFAHGTGRIEEGIPPEVEFAKFGEGAEPAGNGGEAPQKGKR
jgi:hypothetical protein